MPIISQLVNVEYLNQNSVRLYPIADGCSATDTTGSVRIPDELIVDFTMPVDCSVNLDTSNFFISQLQVYGPGITIVISYTDGSSITSVVGSVSINKSTHTENTTYYITGQNNFVDSIGKITIGNLSQTLLLSGVFNFNLSATRLLGTLFPPDIRGVRSLTALNGSESSAQLFGDITLVAGQNMRLRVDNTSKTIWFDALSNDLNTVCGCTNNLPTANPIVSINGVLPDVAGNLQLIGDSCLNITPGGTGALEITDQCSQPCCGSPELQTLQTDFNQLNLDVRTMRDIQTQLENHMQLLDSLTLAIQSTGLLGDSPPTT